jgi:glycosyltransferase involved in cell wall biosynthesis
MGKRLAIIGNQAFAMRNFRGPLIAAAVAKGVEVFAFAPDYEEADRAAIEAIGGKPRDFPLRRASISPLHDLLTVRSLTAQLRKVAPDVVLSFSSKPSVFGTLAATLAGVPRRYALIEGLGHAFIDAESGRTGMLRRVVSGLYRVSLARATAVLFLNDDDRAEFVDGHLVDGAKAETVGAIGVDLDYWSALPPITEPITFLFVGRLLREKGIVEYVEAARRIRNAGLVARFIVLGAPDSNPSSITAAQAHHWVAEGIIEWPGQVDVKPWLEKASVFVLPSYREGVPRSTQEAMASAKPVITTDVPGCRETVSDGQNGILVRARNPAALERAMRTFIDDPSLVGRMGAVSRQMAETRFDVKVATARLVDIMGL